MWESLKAFLTDVAPLISSLTAARSLRCVPVVWRSSRQTLCFQSAGEVKSVYITSESHLTHSLQPTEETSLRLWEFEIYFTVKSQPLTDWELCLKDVIQFTWWRNTSLCSRKAKWNIHNLFYSTCMMWWIHCPYSRASRICLSVWISVCVYKWLDSFVSVHHGSEWLSSTVFKASTQSILISWAEMCCEWLTEWKHKIKLKQYFGN